MALLHALNPDKDETARLACQRKPGRASQTVADAEKSREKVQSE